MRPLDFEMVARGEVLRAVATGLAGADLEEAALAGARAAASVIPRTLDQRARTLDTAWEGRRLAPIWHAGQSQLSPVHVSTSWAGAAGWLTAP